jgi:hypothetical protein
MLRYFKSHYQMPSGVFLSARDFLCETKMLFFSLNALANYAVRSQIKEFQEVLVLNESKTHS